MGNAGLRVVARLLNSTSFSRRDAETQRTAQTAGPLLPPVFAYGYAAAGQRRRDAANCGSELQAVVVLPRLVACATSSHRAQPTATPREPRSWRDESPVTSAVGSLSTASRAPSSS